MNEVILIGRLTRDVEIRQTTTGKTVGNFTLAVNRPRKDEVDFFDCVIWDTAAEILKQYVGKGRQLGVVGHLQTRSWEKEGRKYKMIEIVVDKFDFIGGKKEAELDAGFKDIDAYDDDIPF